MSALQPEVNTTEAPQYQTPQEVALFGCMSVGSSASFLYINSVLLFTLRSKPVFCETSRYVLLYNLLFADTVHMVTNVLFYLLAALKVTMTFYACGGLLLFTVFTDTISPLTLAVMSLEQYVAVVYPLRHAAIFTVRSTGLAVAVVWAFSFIRILIQVFILIYFLSKTNVSLYLKDFCTKRSVFSAPIFIELEEAYSGIVFLSAGLILIASYLGVALVARSVSSDRASATKALQTLLLHQIQLSLVLTSTFYSAIIAAFARTMGRLALTRVYNVCFVFLNILPRCLSALIYGLKNQTIRPILVRNLCCPWRRACVLRLS